MRDDLLLAAARAHASRDASPLGHIVQTETMSDLGAGHFAPVTTAGAAFAGSVVGLGVAEAADGEIVAVDGTIWRVPADGVPRIAPDGLGLPFAIAATGGRAVTVPIAAGASLAEVTSAVDAVLVAHAHLDGGAGLETHVAAVRLDGTFDAVLLRSEHRQEPPYAMLADVLAHEVRFPFAQWSGTLVGFRFPDIADGVVIPGLHVHGISADRASGGHCHEATAVDVTLTVWVDDVRVVVPPVTGGGRTTR